MAGELVLETKVSDPYILRDGKEHIVKACLSVYASDEVKERLEGEKQINNGVDLCLLIDVSGSMFKIVGGDTTPTGRKQIIDGVKYNIVTGGTTKLDIALEAVKKVVDLLRPTDNVTVIAYDDTPHIILQNLAGSDKERITESLEKCKDYSGNTNISEALKLGRLILNNNNNGKIKKMIFMTDGVPYGDTEEAGIRQAKLIAETGISIDCLGFGGNDVNFAFLEKLAKPSNGRTELINEPEEARDMFTELFENSTEVIITNAKLELTFPKYVRVTEHYKGTPEVAYLGKVLLDRDRKATVNLVNIERNQEYKFYFLMTIPGKSSGDASLGIMNAKLEYYIPKLYGNRNFFLIRDVTVDVGDNTSLVEKDGEVERGYYEAEIKKLEDEANIARERNDFNTAIRRYEWIINRYEELGNLLAVKQYRALIDEFRENGTISIQAINNAGKTSTRPVNSATTTIKIDFPTTAALRRRRNG